MNHLTVDRFLQQLHIPYENACTEQSDLASQPTNVKTPLRQHQYAILKSMETLENNLQKGYDLCGQTFYSRFGILGDSVGVGKSLMVLGHISRMKELNQFYRQFTTLSPHSSQYMFSFQNKHISDLSHCSSLIIVPHTLYHQWEKYIKDQTNLKCVYIKTKKSFASKDFYKKCVESDTLLVSNTLVGQFIDLCNQHRLWFSRTFIDEADSIHIPCTKPLPPTSFTWFVTATWQNLTFEGYRTYISPVIIDSILEAHANEVAPRIWKLEDPVILSILRNAQLSLRGLYFRYTSRSASYLREFLRSYHPFRSYLVLRCRDSFIQQSISLPPVSIETIECLPSISQRIVQSAVSSQIQSLLNAGDIQAALTSLGVPSESPLNLIQAVTENREKELERLQATYEFKATQTYSTPQLKQQALDSLQVKISSLQQQIKSIRDRIENYKKEICAICYDEPKEPVLTPCCSRIFCGGCILQSLSIRPGCPMCRELLTPSSLKALTLVIKKVDKKNTVIGPPKKIDALLKLLRENPTDKFLVFSRYENPFSMMQERLVNENVTVKTLKGNKDVIANLLETFQEGSTRVLLLNANHAGAGLNITSATYVVLWHAMTPEEEKQIIGRAYRMGRTQPLKIVKLLHPNERSTVNA